MSLELRKVVRRVGTETHIHETDLALRPAGLTVLLGTTLSGKTTLMQIMAGLIRPTSGQVWFKGADVTGVAVQRRNVAMVHQQFINYGNMTVFDNIASPLRVARLARAEITRRVEYAADLLRLTPLLGRYPSELSGGQQQRTALARALVKDADLVLLDEPLANLDYKLREELRDEMPRLFSGREATVVYATSDPLEAMLLGGFTATMHEGRVTQYGPSGDVYRAPVDLVTARAFSDPPINVVVARKQGDRVVLVDDVGWPTPAGLRARPDGPITVAIRPHHIRPGSTGEVQLDGRVRITELSGSESVIHFEHGTRTWVCQAHGVHALEVGSHATFALDVAECLYFDADGRAVAR